MYFCMYYKQMLGRIYIRRWSQGQSCPRPNLFISAVNTAGKRNIYTSLPLTFPQILLMLALCLTIDSDLHRACNLTRLHAVLHREQLPQPLLSHHHQYVHQRGGGSCFSFSAERILSEFWYLKEERQSDWVLLITSKATQHFTTYLFNFLLS